LTKLNKAILMFSLICLALVLCTIGHSEEFKEIDVNGITVKIPSGIADFSGASIGVTGTNCGRYQFNIYTYIPPTYALSYNLTIMTKNGKKEPIVFVEIIGWQPQRYWIYKDGIPKEVALSDVILYLDKLCREGMETEKESWT